jgi:hypothetical protein
MSKKQSNPKPPPEASKPPPPPAPPKANKTIIVIGDMKEVIDLESKLVGKYVVVADVLSNAYQYGFIEEIIGGDYYLVKISDDLDMKDNAKRLFHLSEMASFYFFDCFKDMEECARKNVD